MTKIIKSYYKLINNFQDDLKGSFLGKLKRRQRTLNLLAWRFLLNRVKPIRLDDLLLPRLKRRTVNSFYTIQLRKLRFFYGFYRGYKSIFFKRLHKFLKGTLFSRTERVLSLLELRLDVVLVRIGLFSNVRIARFYIRRFGVFINDRRIFNFNYVLRVGDVLSILEAHKYFFKIKLFLKLNPANSSILEYTNKERFFSHSAVHLDFFNKFVISELKSFSYYDRFLSSSKNFSSLDLESLRKNRSVFFLSSFPRFLEVNYNTFEFLYNFPLKSFGDVRYPFKVKSLEIKRLIESVF